MLSQRDGLVIMPTGYGKTLCFTLPAVLSPGLTIIIVPTISLMDDLCLRLQTVCQTAKFSGETKEKDDIFRLLSANAIKILLTTPESLQHHALGRILERSNVTRVIVDEAHCCDEWSHEFRPSFLLIKNFAKDKLTVQ